MISHSDQHPTIKETGMTLVELMVVVAILAILVASATVVNSRPERMDSIANRVGATVSAASRKAVSLGASASDDVSDTGARVRFEVFQNRTFVSIQNYPEPKGTDSDSDGVDDAYDVDLVSGSDNDGDGYVDVLDYDVAEQYYLPENTRVIGVDPGVTNTAGGGTPSNLLSTGFTDINCRPAGGCDSATIYLARGDAPYKDKYRIVLLQLSAMPLVLSGW